MRFQYFAFKLLAVCVIVFILQNIFPITEDFALISKDVFTRPWILISSIFLHGSFQHLFYNMFALGLFGFILEKIIGSKNFIILFFASGLIAGIGSVPFYEAALGASGAIFGILGCLAILRPRMIVYVGYIPMPMILAAVVWAVGDLIGMFIPSGIANAAHLFGLCFGIIFGLKLMKKFGEKRPKKKKEIVSDEEIDKWEREWMLSITHP